MASDFLKSHGFDLSSHLAGVDFGRAATEYLMPELKPSHDSDDLKKIIGVRLPDQPYLWDVHLSRESQIKSSRLVKDSERDQPRIISAITSHDFNSPIDRSPSVLEARGCLLTPSLCHAHIHLDKCFLLQDRKFSDLQIVDGSFSEAMALTSKAKKRFSKSDLLRRGRQLIIESIQAGVTHMRAFCEVDGIVGLTCLDAGLELQKDFRDQCHVQICAFAQLPVFSGDDAGLAVRELLTEAARRDGVDVVGSTPYVEEDEENEKKNVEWTIDLAIQQDKFLDLHLDYHMDEAREPLIWHVLSTLKSKQWSKKTGKKVTLAHCTRLCQFRDEEWQELRNEAGSLPISLVGLPTSDLFMMRTEQRWRGSLHIPDLIRKQGFRGAIAVNNVGNAFTPQGNSDPISIASLGVGLYSAGTKADTDLLFDCVSGMAKEAIGIHKYAGLCVREGDPADFLIFEKSHTKMRTRKTIADVVYDPPSKRIVIKNGVIICR